MPQQRCARHPGYGKGPYRFHASRVDKQANRPKLGELSQSAGANHLPQVLSRVAASCRANREPLSGL